MATPNQTLQNIDQTLKKVNFLWDQFAQVAEDQAQWDAKKLQVDFKDQTDKLKSEIQFAQQEIAQSIGQVENYITNLTPESAKADLEKLNNKVNSEIQDFSNNLNKSIQEEQAKLQLQEFGTKMKYKAYEANQQLKASLQNLNNSLQSMGEALQAQWNDDDSDAQATDANTTNTQA